MIDLWSLFASEALAYHTLMIATSGRAGFEDRLDVELSRNGKGSRRKYGKITWVGEKWSSANDAYCDGR